jgi:UDP-N-acetyl-2-amino-2-deoxyglucuronate dehydrogenase
MKKLGIGIYGIGWVAGAHITALLQNSNVEIVALGSRKRESAQQAKDTHKLANCTVVNSFEEMLKLKDVDIIDICTPNKLHAEEAIAAARAGKHVVIEKPAIMNFKELKSLRDEIKKAGVKSQTCFECRFNPNVQGLRSMVDNGGLGKLFYMEVDYYHEIGAWWHGYSDWGVNKIANGPSTSLVGACHAIDMLTYFGGDVDEVFAYGCWGHRKDYEYAPTIAALVKFKDGMIGKTGGSYEIESPYLFNMLLHGSKGSVTNEKFYTKAWFAGQTHWQTFNTIFLDTADVAHHPFKAMFDEFIDCVVNNKVNLLNIDQSYRSHELCLAIDRSIATGKPVKLPLTE